MQVKDLNYEQMLRTVVEFTGTLEASSVMASVTTSGNSWNSVGNPYPSAIFMNDNANATDNFININVNNLDVSYATAYVWDQTAYTPVDIDGPAFNAAVGQAFMIKAKSGVTEVQFTNAMQTNDASAKVKGGIIRNPEIKLIAESSDKRSYTRVNFKEGMSEGLDVGYDAGIYKSGFDLYSKLVRDNGVNFALQYLPASSLEKSEVALGINIKNDDQVTFSAETINLPLGTNILLEDRLTGSFTSLKDGETYTTQVEKDEMGGRFFLHTVNSNNATTGIGNSKGQSDIQVYQANDNIVISGQIPMNANAVLYDMVGRRIKIVELDQIAMNFISTSDIKTGIYMLKIQLNGNIFSQKIAVNR